MFLWKLSSVSIWSRNHSHFFMQWFGSSSARRCRTCSLYGWNFCVFRISCIVLIGMFSSKLCAQSGLLWAGMELTKTVLWTSDVRFLDVPIVAGWWPVPLSWISSAVGWQCFAAPVCRDGVGWIHQPPLSLTIPHVRRVNISMILQRQHDSPAHE